jgi:hypothetical protein
VMVLSTFRASLFPLINPLWKCPPRHNQVSLPPCYGSWQKTWDT